MHARDVRAVENPITAIFDLAEEVEVQAPKIHRLLRYTRVFVSLWLVLDFALVLLVAVAKTMALLLILLLWGLLLIRSGTRNLTLNGLLIAASVVTGIFLVLAFGEGLVLGAVLVALFALGMAILDLIRDARSFLDYYALRYRVVRAVRDADPVVYVPKGDTPVQRLLSLLAGRSPAVAAMLARPDLVRAPALLAGRSGMAYQFDAFLSWPAGVLAPLGVGVSGSAVYVKAFVRVPTRADLEMLRRAVEDVSAAVRLPPMRVIALWRSDGTTDVPDDAYAFLTTEVVRASVRGVPRACSIELVTEMPDGTYDFIPLIVDAPPAPPPPMAAPRPA